MIRHSIKNRKYFNERYQANALGMVIFLVILSLFAPAEGAFAAETDDPPEKVQDIKITVGYEGLKSYSKSVLSLEDLEKEEFQLKKHREIFTWIGDDKSCRTTEAEGIYLSELLDYAQIDQDAIYSYDFLIEDSEEGSDEDADDRNWEQKDLFEGTDGDRYTYVNLFRIALEQYNDCEDKDDYRDHPNKYLTVDDIFDFGSAAAYKNLTWSYKTRIEPLLALKSFSANWQKGGIPPTNLDYANLEEETAPVLCIGQASKGDVAGGRTELKVSQINVYFEGTPEISVKTSNLNGAVGSTGSITAKVTTPDQLLTEMIESEITFESSNTSVATVDEKGNVKIIGEGKASVTALYDSDGDGTAETVGTAAVNGKAAGENPEEGSSGGNDASGSSGGGNDSGSSDGSSDRANDSGDETASGTDRSSSGNGSDVTVASRNATVPSSASGTGTQATSRSRTATAPSAGNSGAATTGDLTDLDDGDVVSLGNGTTDTGDGLAYEVTAGPSAGQDGAGTDRKKVVMAILAGGIALIGGAILVTGNYWMQTEWIERAKKIFEKQG